MPQKCTPWALGSTSTHCREMQLPFVACARKLLDTNCSTLQALEVNEISTPHQNANNFVAVSTSAFRQQDVHIGRRLPAELVAVR